MFQKLILAFNYLFLQVPGVNKIRIGNSSSLPASISKHKTSFDKTDREEKLPTGPIIFPRPGPMLLRQVVTDVTVVVKSRLFIEISKTDEKKTII